MAKRHTRKPTRASRPDSKNPQPGSVADDAALLRNLDRKRESALLLSSELGVWFGDLCTQPLRP